MPTGSQRQAGFTYIGLLIAVVFFGLGSVGAARLLASTERAEREAELLFIGHQFRQAIRSYVETGPRAGQYPVKLDELLQDNRYPTAKRHLRRLFVDPITGQADWGLVLAPEGGIMGVHSLSSREPQKQAKFRLEDASIELAVKLRLDAAQSDTQDKYSYRDWQFVYRPLSTGGARQPAQGR